MSKSTIVEYPEQQRLFTSNQICDALDISMSRLYSIKHCLKFKPAYFDGKHNHFNYQQFKMIKEWCEKYEAKKQASYEARHKKYNEEEVKPNIAKQRELHPLVKDDKFFNFNYWPDVIPECFADVVLD